MKYTQLLITAVPRGGPIVNIAEVTPVKFSMLTVQILTPKNPGLLIRLSSNFHKMYRNDWQLTNWNQNCDIPLCFRMPACQMNDDCQIAAESRHIFNFCSLKLWSYCTDLYQKFTRCRSISVAINPRIYKRQYFVSKCQSMELRRSVLTSAERPQS